MHPEGEHTHSGPGGAHTHEHGGHTHSHGGSHTHSEGSAHIEQNRCFAVNVLHADQEPLSRYFASRERPRRRDAFKEVAHRTAASGSPILDGAIAYLDCRLHGDHEAGDHQIFIGEVLELGHNPEGKPLVFHGGKYKLVGG